MKTSEINLQEALQVVSPLVKQAGEKARQHWQTALTTKAKGDEGLDLTTNIDEEIEVDLVEQLTAKYPAIGFQVEENSELNKKAEYQWVIDPIDGTKYYASGIPLFCIAVALTKNTRPILGVVYNPITQELYTGSQGISATRNGQAISVAPTATLERTMLTADWSNLESEWPAMRPWILDKLGKLADATYRVRSFGASQLSLVWLASGGVTNAFVHLTGVTKPMDIAAGIAICEAAGAITLTSPHPINGRPIVIVARPPIAEALHEIVFS